LPAGEHLAAMEESDVSRLMTHDATQAQAAPPSAARVLKEFSQRRHLGE